MLMVGPPGSGKSMLAARLAGLLPPLSASEALEVSMIHSLAGQLPGGSVLRARPFRDPHHSASMVALVGGGLRVKPGEISLAHRGVLFLDELPEFAGGALEALRQPLETGRVTVARANNHVSYPARFQLVAAMNPCRCGHLDQPQLSCGKAPRCAVDYQTRISGPMFDRIDIHADVPAVNPLDLSAPAASENSATVAARIAHARAIQTQRFAGLGASATTNAEADGEVLDQIAAPDTEGRDLLTRAADRMMLSARGYHRILRVARTIADLDGSTNVRRPHIAEALSYRRVVPGRTLVS
jgi:magnesium chelatase family protein